MLQTSSHTPPFTPLPSCRNKTPVAEASPVPAAEPKLQVVPEPENAGVTSTVHESGNATKTGNGGTSGQHSQMKAVAFFGGLMIFLLKILLA